MAAELDALMIRNLRLFMDNPQWGRELAASSAITQIEAAVREQAVQQESEAAQRTTNKQISANPFGHALSEAMRSMRTTKNFH